MTVGFVDMKYGDIGPHGFRDDGHPALTERIQREDHVVAALQQIGSYQADHRHVGYSHRPSLGL
jgi:hypothetical protein